MINFNFENVIITIMIISTVFYLFFIIIKNKKILKPVIILFILLFFVLFCVKLEEKSYYEVNNPIKNFEINSDNKISQISISDDNLIISVDKFSQKLYKIEKIEIERNGVKIGKIYINKNLDELYCNGEREECEYSINKELTKILDEKNLQSELNTGAYIYNNNYFNFKIFVENKKNLQKIEYILDEVGIIYIKKGLQFNWIPM